MLFFAKYYFIYLLFDNQKQNSISNIKIDYWNREAIVSFDNRFALSYSALFFLLPHAPPPAHMGIIKNTWWTPTIK